MKVLPSSDVKVVAGGDDDGGCTITITPGEGASLSGNWAPRNDGSWSCPPDSDSWIVG